jgi:hypothetical protein
MKLEYCVLSSAATLCLILAMTACGGGFDCKSACEDVAAGGFWNTDPSSSGYVSAEEFCTDELIDKADTCQKCDSVIGNKLQGNAALPSTCQ